MPSPQTKKLWWHLQSTVAARLNIDDKNSLEHIICTQTQYDALFLEKNTVTTHQP